MEKKRVNLGSFDELADYEATHEFGILHKSWADRMSVLAKVPQAVTQSLEALDVAEHALLKITEGTPPLVRGVDVEQTCRQMESAKEALQDVMTNFRQLYSGGSSSPHQPSNP